MAFSFTATNRREFNRKRMLLENQPFCHPLWDDSEKSGLIKEQGRKSTRRESVVEKDVMKPEALGDVSAVLTVKNSEDRVVHFENVKTNGNGGVRFNPFVLPDVIEADSFLRLEFTANVSGAKEARKSLEFAKVARPPHFIPANQLAAYREFDKRMPLAEAGDLRAMEAVATSYATGQGIVKNDEESRKWRNQAAGIAFRACEKKVEEAITSASAAGVESYDAAQWRRLQAQWSELRDACTREGASQPKGRSAPSVSEVQGKADEIAKTLLRLAGEAEQAKLFMDLKELAKVVIEVFSLLDEHAKIHAPLEYAELSKVVSGIRAVSENANASPDLLREKIEDSRAALSRIQALGKELREKQVAAAAAAPKPTPVSTATPSKNPEADLGFTLEGRRQKALVIGIDQYRHYNKLANAVNDAKAVAETLKERYGFGDVRTLFDGAATKDGILRATREMVEALQEGEDILIYYAGHGWLDRTLNEGYWITVEAENQSQYLSNSEIHRYVKAMNSRKAAHVLVISDSCFSGSIVGDMRDPRSVNVGVRQTGDRQEVSKWVTRLYADKSRQAITSGGNRPVADGGAEGHSIFAYYLLKAMRQPKHNVFTATELAAEVSRLVGDNSDQSPRLGVIMYSGHEGGEFVFVGRH